MPKRLFGEAYLQRSTTIKEFILRKYTGLSEQGFLPDVCEHLDKMLFIYSK